MGKQIKSIEQLRRELQARESELSGLQSQRTRLSRELAAVDQQIAALTGEAPARGRGKKRGRKAAVQKRGKRGRARKPVKRGGLRMGQKPLAEYIQEALAKEKNGLGIKDIAEAVQAAGYTTTSKNFAAVVTILLGKDKRFEKVSRGVYRLA